MIFWQILLIVYIDRFVGIALILTRAQTYTRHEKEEEKEKAAQAGEKYSLNISKGRHPIVSGTSTNIQKLASLHAIKSTCYIAWVAKS